MRHRITYIHKNNDAVRSVSSSGIELDPEGDYVQEQRSTAALGPEYPHVKDLRIQISTDDRPSFPFSYEFQSGLHIYAVPQGLQIDEDKDSFYNQLERLLEDLLGIQISSDAFILAYNSFYYHSLTADVAGAFAGFKLPKNWSKIDYFRSNGEVSLKALSFSPETTIGAEAADERTEIGVFSVLPQSEPDDVILSGGRLVLGDHADKTDKLTKTLFHIKPRHRRLGGTAQSEIVPNGLHPVLAVDSSVQAPTDSDVAQCQLYAYMTLEKSVFLDPYQLPAGLKLVANYGPQNLELPEYAVPQWGNELLFEPKGAGVHFNLTLHSRYQLPKPEPQTHVALNKPSLFYACEVTDDALLLKQSPFDNFHYLGGTFEKFFTENSVFYHVPEEGQLSVAIPNATGDASWANSVTFAALFLGCLLVLSGLANRVKAFTASHAKKVQ